MFNLGLLPADLCKPGCAELLLDPPRATPPTCASPPTAVEKPRRGGRSTRATASIDPIIISSRARRGTARCSTRLSLVVGCLPFYTHTHRQKPSSPAKEEQIGYLQQRVHPNKRNSRLQNLIRFKLVGAARTRTPSITNYDIHSPARGDGEPVLLPSAMEATNPSHESS